MSEAITFLDALAEAVTRAGQYNRNDQVPPAAVLWPDKERQWEALLPQLRERLPLLTFGSYDPAQRTGPVYWLRCMIAHTLPEDRLPEGATPILYLPGISKQEIRAVEECPKLLQPLAELQYRGVLWTQKNGRDWTLAAFLQSKDGGLGLEVGADSATREALQRALLKLAVEPLAALRKAVPLKAAFFDALLNPDEVRTLLLWLNDPAGYPRQMSPETWAAFCAVCRQKYDFHPESDGPVSAAQRLGRQAGTWAHVWERYLESPQAYPRLPELLWQARPPQLALFEPKAAWPQDNQAEEDALRQSLRALEHATPQQSRAALAELETQHASRRAWVWAELGRAPLAQALAALATLAQHTEQRLGGADLAACVAAYTVSGWQADAAVLAALAAVERAEDVAAVKFAIRAVYAPWLEAAASTFQALVDVASVRPDPSVLPTAAGTCILFSDALRFDVGQRLIAALAADGYRCVGSVQLAALPTITATAKPALSPVAALLSGKGAAQLTPTTREAQTQLTAEVFRKLLAEAGYQVLLDEDALGDPAGKAWTELGAIDRYGHQHGWKLAQHIAGELRAVQQRIAALLEHGWARVVLITDHGWLLLPGGLPKAELPEHLTVLRKGRCARLKDFAVTSQPTAPWFWDADVQLALAPGSHCFEAGKEYEHGGLSPQECVTPVITVTRAEGATSPARIEAVTWRGLRCTVKISGGVPGLRVDLRAKAGDASASLVTEPKLPEADGVASLLVADEEQLGAAAFVVVIGQQGLVCAQTITTIGG